QGGIVGYIDVIPFHFYTYLLAPETIGPSIANVRLVMAKNGVSNMPFWDTEGASGDQTVSELQGAAYIVRRYLVDLAYGSARYDWYTWSKGSTFCAATEENDPRQLTKAGVAFGVVQRWLTGASLTGVSIDGAGTWQMSITLAGGAPAMIVWNPSASASFAIPSSLQAATALDIFNGSTAIQGSTITVNAYPLLLSGFNGTLPPAPTSLSAAAGNGQVSLAWSTSAGATYYDVYGGVTAGGENVVPIASGLTTASYTATGLANGTPYYYKVSAVNAGGASALSNEATATPRATAPGSPLLFVPVTPCRVVDTRNTFGPFGGPAMTADSTRSFAIPQSGCGIPDTAQAYSLNVTVVPRGALSYLTLWPEGQARPLVSTLNSFGGTVVANAAIVPAGSGGAVSVYVTNPTDVILDIDGYFDASSGAGSYSLYPAAPCRVADTRGPTGQFGGPAMYKGETRGFPVPLGPCGTPATARAYSLNVTAVPAGYLGYLTTWPTGGAQPLVSTLNSWTGKVVANAALVPAGTNESVSVFVSDPSNVILDINGYFGQPGLPGALSFYPVAPCRVADTRGAVGPFGGPEMEARTMRSFTIPASACGVPATAAAYSMNVTVVPDAILSYLTAWPAGSAQPFVSTLNSFDGAVVANAAIVPAGTNGAISVFVTDRTQVILDINGYFAP
ncbi:MAG TPA: fibronectin type III domain-containing protein, partial [Bryobacteraceae bacterium]|nr:fibronectin type III domain-containing protein [Bryobacteraceae bacterium]